VSSLIEQHLYGSHGTHALLSLTLAEGRVVVAVAPWSQLTAVTVAAFEAAELVHVWAAPDTPPAEIALPWDIIGFDSTDLGGGRWEFLVNCSDVEFCWRSTWPVAAAEQRHAEPGAAADPAS
jgi:hypothetical protein